MRVLKFLLTSAIVLVIVAGVGFVVVREALLFAGMSTLRSSVSKMRNTSANLGPYVQECQRRGSNDTSQSIIDVIQLRFTSANEYQLEARCRQFLLDPLLISKGTLPPFVKKAAGTSGLILDESVTSVTLEIWGRQRSMVLQNLEASYTNQPVNTPVGTGPVTSCQGYGFQCCHTESALGTGDMIPQAVDCPRSCFSQCVSRPIVLSFSSDPFYDPKTRTLEIADGEVVNFNSVVDLATAQSGQVILDFGDGEQETFEVMPESLPVPHTYRCAQAQCEYTVQVKVIDNRETESAGTTVTRIKVVVSR